MIQQSGYKVPKNELPWVGVGIATEYVGKQPIFQQLHREHGDLLQFVEYGGTVEYGLDEGITEWAQAGHRSTYHYLDINLSDGTKLSQEWCDRTAELARQINAPWICGDIGLWYYGERALKNIMLTHPILSAESATQTAEAIVELQERTGFNCLPENPPSHAFLGDLHLLDYFAQVTDQADCWMTLDCAHLLMYQYAHNCDPVAGLDAFPLDRVGEIHIAGGTLMELAGQRYIIDSHLPQILPDVWKIVDYILPRATNLRAICLEAEERNGRRVAELLRQIHSRVPRTAQAAVKGRAAA